MFSQCCISQVSRLEAHPPGILYFEETFLFKSNPGKAVELERCIQVEAAEKVFPAEPKAFLTGEDLVRAQEQARKAVAPEVMQATDEQAFY